ncbi:MAG: hypothetical protein NW207_09530 [Cytophagales bacterium]|nr:hypothetical protein [Cytophagales bacterium]
MKNLLAILGIPLLLLSCNVPNPKDKGYDTKEIAEEIRNKKIKKLTPTQINAWVYEEGLKIQSLLNQQGFSEAQTDSLEKAKKIKIESIDLSKKEQIEKYKGKTRQIIEACAYEIENGKVVKSNLQQLENQDFIFTVASDKSEKSIKFIYFYKKEVVKQIDTKKLR